MTPGFRQYRKRVLKAAARDVAEKARQMDASDLDIRENANGDLIVSVIDGPPPPPKAHRVRIEITRQQAAEMAKAKRLAQEADQRWAKRSREVIRLAQGRK